MKPLQDSDPRSIGRYQLLGVLGEGGMGRVYLGVDEGGQKVAVKVVYAELVRDEDFRERFTREASATAAVSGRFIARIVAADLDSTPPWLATEYIDGPSLYDVVGRQGDALSPSRAQEIAASLAEALDTIHAAGVVHRDVKPANVLLGPDGAYLIDFGIAREAAASTITRTGTVVGTPPFMAPEQIRGRRTLGPSADIFALGGVLAYAITGRHPFGEGDNTSLAYRIVHEEPDLDGVEDQIVKALILACLAKKPEDRPSAAEVQARLGGAATRVIPAPNHGAGAAAGAAGAAMAAGAAVAPTVAIAGANPHTLVDDQPPTDQNRRRRWAMAGLATAAVLAVSGGIIGADLGGGKKPGDSGKAALGGGAYPAAATDSSNDSRTSDDMGPDTQATTPGSALGAPPPINGANATPPAGVPGPDPSQGPGPNPAPGTTVTDTQPAPPHTTPTSAAATTKKPPAPTTSHAPHGNPPPAPTNAAFAIATLNNFTGFVVNLSWLPVNGATGYDIHYTNNGLSMSGQTTDTILHTTGTGYQLSGWAGYPTGYCFVVRAVNANGASAWDSNSPHCG